VHDLITVNSSKFGLPCLIADSPKPRATLPKPKIGSPEVKVGRIRWKSVWCDGYLALGWWEFGWKSWYSVR